MGWSFAAAAGKVTDAWEKACIASTDSQNTWKDSRGVQYFWEASRVEHSDGAITGQIFKILPNGLCRTSGTFRIDGNGTIVRAPQFLKDVWNEHKKV